MFDFKYGKIEVINKTFPMIDDIKLDSAIQQEFFTKEKVELNKVVKVALKSRFEVPEDILRDSQPQCFGTDAWFFIVYRDENNGVQRVYLDTNKFHIHILEINDSKVFI